MPGALRRRVQDSPVASLTLGHLWLLVPWVGLAIAAFQPVRDNSFLWHVRAGTIQIDSGRVLVADPFSFTFSGEPWRTQSWLPELFFGQLEGWSGLGFVPFWTLAMAVVVFLAAGNRLQPIVENVRGRALALVFLVWVAVGFVVPRPVLVSFVLLSLLLGAVASQRLRWLIPLIMWIWAASHGSFVLGIGYLILEAVRSRRFRMFGSFAVAGMALASLTAHGFQIWSTLLAFTQNREALSYISEWSVPSLTDLSTLPFFLGIGGLLWNGIQGRISKSDLWVVLPFLAFGLTSQRAVFPAMLVLLPWMTPWNGIRGRQGMQTENPVAVVIGGLAILVLPVVLVARPGTLDPTEFPIEAARTLSGSAVFHDDYVGGYLIYALWPDVQVFVDDRAELYGGDFFDDVLHSRLGGPQWTDTENRWEIDEVLIRSEDALVEVLEQSGWSYIYDNGEFVVLTR